MEKLGNFFFLLSLCPDYQLSDFQILFAIIDSAM